MGVTRSRASAKAAGSSFERLVADYMRDRLSPFIDRRVKTGARDRGDIANVQTSKGERVVVECKDVATLALPAWLREAETERVNDGAAIGVVVHKRRGTTAPGEQYVTMSLATFCDLLDGIQHDKD